MTDFAKVRADFPVLSETVRGKQLVYLDNGATTQKPQSVIDCIDEYYSKYNSNIHRGVHHLSQVATQAYEDARETIRGFLGAKSINEIIFTSGTTGGINLVASTWGRKFVKEGDEILISAMEHHSNIVPWQMLAERKQLTLKYVPINEKGELRLELLDELLTTKTKLFAFSHISNSLGTINPIKEMIAKAHSVGCKVLLDAAQSLQHCKVNVAELDVDFLVFSGHKVFGPTGTGILFGKKELLNAMPPYRGGGDMIKTVKMSGMIY